MGPRVSAAVAAVGIVAGAVAVLIGAAGGEWDAVTPLSWAFFGVVVVLAVVTAWRAISRPPTRALFRLVMVAALLLAVQLVASGGALAA
jgi:hypothetical protein